MIPQIRRLPGLVVVALVLVCPLTPRFGRAADTASAPPGVREPAVAGLFYPKDPAALAKMVDAFLADAQPPLLPGELKALICPHAGYPYSGPVAACAYKLLAGRHYDTVIVMGPSHYAELGAASVTAATVYRTPLGDVPVPPKARQLAALPPFALEPACYVHRPDWWQQASHPAPAVDKADTWEHSVEVQVPFLQRTLKKFQLVPVVFGQVNPRRAADALQRVLDDHTLIVASSDLSHYDTYEHAETRDHRCIDAICNLEESRIAGDDACGAMPIRTLLVIARQRGWQPHLLDYRNSGDTTGDKSHGVVGYAAIAFYAPTAPAGQTFSAADRQYLLRLARNTLYEVTANGRLPDVPATGLASRFTTPKGCFVTLTKQGDLRGCIGYILPQGPLYRAVMENARNAALQDPRFPPVTAREVNQLAIEISVLTEPQPLAFTSPDDLLRQLQPGIDGVVLRIGDRSATFLPQVWEQLPDKEVFLSQLAAKAGCAPSAWRQAGAAVFIYRVESFKESDFAATPAHRD